MNKSINNQSDSSFLSINESINFLYSFSLELFAKPTIKTIDDTTIKASIVGLRPISLAVNAKNKLVIIKFKDALKKTKLNRTILKDF